MPLVSAPLPVGCLGRYRVRLSIIAIALSANAKNMPTINDAIAISADLMRKRFIRR
jgi:hydroxyethylthiazole kinase-like sugar kinase family protein